ncbi:MAG: NAD(P)/FAD-dependent oxidoreductase [Granulosicoccus sp.]|nr:NAD(P)/FAD-dependent oxidoreductase [Granulosicoccus sp.]
MQTSVENLIVGGGQAGLAMSEHLSLNGAEHLILERGRIAERWRSQRWDSLVANGPAWHDRFPSMEFSGIGPDEFASRETVSNYFSEYARQINAPIRCGVEVLEVVSRKGQTGYHVVTSEGEMTARNVICATGGFQQPVIPSILPDTIPELLQLHSSDYRNARQLPDGATLVIGAGSSGTQIAEDLFASGKRVYLSVGPHDRPPRRYRGRDFVWWLGVLGKWDAEVLAPGTEHVTIAVSGVNGGHTIDFRRMASRGITLTGMTESYRNDTLFFASDLAENIAKGDANYLSLLDEADAYVQRNGLELPTEPEARVFDADPPCVSHPISQLNLTETNITSIIWATGYRFDYSFLHVDVLDDQGRPRHHRGITSESGLYFLGLPWQTRRGSSFIWGVWHDARYLAEHIAKQKSYLDYHLSASVNHPG